MKNLLLVLVTFTSIGSFACDNLLNEEMRLLDSTVKENLCKYEGKVMLVVNVASKCGFTPQYDGLEELQKKYSEKNFSVLAFPCNQFGNQEPGSNEEIQEFCSINFQTSFPVMGKIDVNGKNAEPLYDFLKSEKKGLLGSKAIKWNFTKFLVNKDGEVIKRYSPCLLYTSDAADE